ncbi:MAG: hypothetical protein LPK02_11130, partial [Rhodobacterales bacterium]|nr:hypothetical protein [Rhodobacterales bacterium]MDX5413585.1 hypothetical protein [Rhodobacterales bacterium]
MRPRQLTVPVRVLARRGVVFVLAEEGLRVDLIIRPYAAVASRSSQAAVNASIRPAKICRPSVLPWAGS